MIRRTRKPVTVRTTAGRLHIAIADGPLWAAACRRTISRYRPDLVVYDRPRERARAWRLELRCTDCNARAALGPRALAEAAGWR